MEEHLGRIVYTYNPNNWGAEAADCYGSLDSLGYRMMSCLKRKKKLKFKTGRKGL